MKILFGGKHGGLSKNMKKTLYDKGGFSLFSKRIWVLMDNLQVEGLFFTI
jgi:hypothetical protein